jgi:microcin C transport system ATP-binding protein
MPLLTVNNLSVSFASAGHNILAVNDVSFSIEKGEIMGLVGESGSGKSVTALSIMRLLPYPQASHPSGEILMDGEDVLTLPEAKIRAIRGHKIGIIFQEPMTALNPLHTIGSQIGEPMVIHGERSKEKIEGRVRQMLDLVGLSELKERLGAYPHELSGGQRQRVMIAMALINEPDLLIADEPTTALDVTVQKQVLDLLLELREKLGMAILLITHDLNIVRHMADKVCVMKDGNIVEQGKVSKVFKKPTHEYTKHLLNAAPKGDPVSADKYNHTILRAKHISVRFPIKKGVFRQTVDYVYPLDNINVAIKKGHTLGVVGESGSGKTTLASAILKLIKCKGEVEFGNVMNTLALVGEPLRLVRRDMQMVFQDPFSSLNPRMSVKQIIEEGLNAHGIEGGEALIAQTLERVGLDPSAMHRYPHEFSGGQRQRIAIARAIILKPKFMVLDEPTSALDMSVQAQIIDLLKKLQEEEALTYLFISHDLKVIKAISHDILVLKHGKVIEYGDAAIRRRVRPKC